MHHTKRKSLSASYRYNEIKKKRKLPSKELIETNGIGIRV